MANIPSTKLTKTDYKAFRMEFDRLRQVMPLHPLLVAMTAKLTEIDLPEIPLPEGWRELSEREMWEGRPTDYEYLV